MLAEYSVEELQPFGNLIEPMAWGYVDDISNYFPKEMFARFGQVFENMWVASSFKGSSGKQRVPIWRKLMRVLIGVVHIHIFMFCPTNFFWN